MPQFTHGERVGVRPFDEKLNSLVPSPPRSLDEASASYAANSECKRADSRAGEVERDDWSGRM